MESDDYGRTDTVDHSIDTWEVWLIRQLRRGSP
jgi:hypothetical protein